ncbi:MAG: efflux RND transporter periplasmic adaptor subunit [Xanthomonadales bacterium]|nr:efflux RND transporter periplasmic adaptor subunit [Xanthomonadales bacterium]
MSTETSKTVAVIAGIGVALVAGVLLEARLGLLGAGPHGQEPSGQPAEREILYWVAPMDANYRRDEPGKSPMGMDLVPVYADEVGADAVEISPVVEQNIGVRTAPAGKGRLWRKIDATGSVGPDENRVGHVHVRIRGWIQSLQIKTLGESVTRGQLLFELYSPELVNAQKEYLLARRRGDEEMIDAAVEKLGALGMIGSDIRALAQRGSPSETVAVIAPQDGVVIALNVFEGMHVMPETHAISLADLSQVWIHAAVPESRLDWVRQGQPAEARFGAIPGDVFEGQVAFVSPILDPKTRTLPVRIEVPNSDGRLRPNMFSRVTIFGGARNDVLSIPREALIRSGRADRVVVALGDGRFRVHEVVAGIESGDWVEIREGLDEGTEVVVSAQFLIDSEASVSGAIRRLGQRP